MSSLLSNNQNTRQSMSPSEAVEELKSFINFELMKTNDVFRESIEQKLMTTIEKFEEQMKRESKSITSNITIGKVRSLISEALAVYDADKTGQPDYALEPSGGTIINTRCSETYDPHGVQYKIFGIPFWSSSVSPRAVIQPTISPGECWAFRGSNGYLVIRLSQAIYPSGFTYEHISKQISRDGNIDSAPKEFQVRALDDETDTTGHLLGNYVYEDNNTPMQYFAVEDPNPRAVELIELVILSNHGHNDYTCLYRFRIHGKRINT
ncbi:SUN domain-containing protein 1-like [Oppia nitens]|uniref:SUN domain-containing protein 1-like n=1 Tax=Oppia nitens TaxID=1686743 RepID=UPI0023DA3131|nr:SUN domain-containing protein 1-like [Oppia nitens]